MKKLIYLMAVSAVLCSCGKDFLNREPEGNYVEETYYVSDKALEAATAPLYNRAWFDYNKRPAVALGSLTANDAYNPWMNAGFVTFQVTALDGSLSDTWKSFYSVITMSNSVINACKTKVSSDCTEEGIKRAIAEARLMRGCAYYYLVHIWDPVILFEDNQSIVDNPVRQLNKEEDVFKFMINDFAYATRNLPETWDKGRATKWAAEGMLAKAYLARSGWNGGARNESDLDSVKVYCKDICENSGLHLLDDYANLFKYKYNNNEESLLAMEWVPLGDWGTCNTLLADLAFSSDVCGGVNVWGGGLNASPDMLMQYETADTIRRNATFFTQGTYYPYICISDGGYTYKGTNAPIKKGVVGGPNDDNDGYVQSMNSPLNTYILRLADVYLMYAEACLGNNETLSEGPGLLFFNKVRKRAELSPKASITLDDIIKERRVEFCMEYSNWYDMINWYKWKPEKMLSYFNTQLRGWRATVKKDAEGKLEFSNWDKPASEIVVTADKMRFPYPESDVIQNPYLKQDPVSYNFNE